MTISIKATRHQNATIDLIKHRKDVPYIFLIGGYGAGKSMTDVILALYLISLYNTPYYHGEQIHVGLLGVTIKLLTQTVLSDIESVLDRAGYPYKDNKQQGILTVGNVTFIYLPCQDPDDIYAHNFHCAIIDELDEVPADRVKGIITAVQERCRKRMPLLDREPFIFISTTAQGMGGTYNLVAELKKQHIRHAIIHARTSDNPYISKQQLELLRALYTEDEARAYLDGEFVNLTQGRVYWAFKRSEHCYMRFGIREEDTIYVGQDFNYGYNAAVICIVRNDVIYVVDSRYWLDMRQGMEYLRNKYPRNKIVMIPDASGKEIMQGFVDETEYYGIELFWNSRNPSITERIMAINKAFTFGQLKVMAIDENDTKSKQDKLLLGLETRDFDDMGKPRKGKGEDALDHCDDALEYATWHIVHSIGGFEKILAVLGGGLKKIA